VTWEKRLFSLLDDLEQQAEGMYAVERDLEVADRAQAEYARVGAPTRLMASVGAEVSFQVRGVGALTGELRRVADGWCLVVSGGRQWIVRFDALSAARGLSSRSEPEVAWPVTARLGLGSALRRIAAAGEPCQLRLVDGSQYDVRLARVGRDFVEAFVGSEVTPALFWFDALAAVHQRGQVDSP
jgi:hypothetical protein